MLSPDFFMQFDYYYWLQGLRYQNNFHLPEFPNCYFFIYLCRIWKKNLLKSTCGDKTVVRSSYLHNGISYTGKMSSLYWIGTQLVITSQHYDSTHFDSVCPRQLGNGTCKLLDSLYQWEICSLHYIYPGWGITRCRAVIQYKDIILLV